MTDTTAPTTDNPVTDKPAKIVTFDDIAKHPNGLTQLSDTARLFSRHAETIRRWVRSNSFIKPVVINGFYYFKNSDLLAYVESQQATA